MVSYLEYIYNTINAQLAPIDALKEMYMYARWMDSEAKNNLQRFVYYNTYRDMWNTFIERQQHMVMDVCRQVAASKTIQNAFRIANSNPNMLLCQKRLKREFKEMTDFP